MTKAEIRSALLARRARVSADERAAASQTVAKQLLARPECARASRLGCFLSLPQEIDTAGFIDACQAAGREICVPARNPSTGLYEFVRLEPRAGLATGPHGVREPAVRRVVQASSLSFIVVPGLAFDRCGGRVGFGKGCYDRLLSGCSPDCIKAGVGYTWQVVDEPLPLTVADVRMDLVVTDAGEIACRESLAKRAESAEQPA